MKAICTNCGKEFNKLGTAKTCSKECSHVMYNRYHARYSNDRYHRVKSKLYITRGLRDDIKAEARKRFEAGVV